MTTKQEARAAIAKRFGAKQDRLDSWPAYLGNEDGTVAGSRAGYVYVRYPSLNSAAVEVENGGVPEVAGLRVMVGYRPERPNTVQALGVADVRTETGTTPVYGVLPPHARQHFWTGSDPVYIDFKQVTQFKVYPSSGLIVNVYGGYIQRGAAVIAIDSTTIDLTTSVPSTGGQGRYALITIDTTGAFDVTDGTAIDDYTLLTYTDIPATPTGHFRLAAVRLYNGQVSISDNATVTDILDLRWPQETIAGALPVAQIDGATAQYQYIVSGASPDYAAGWSAGLLNIASGKTLTVSDDLTVGSLTSGRVLYASADDTIGDDVNFTWNSATRTLTLIGDAYSYSILSGSTFGDAQGILINGGDGTVDYQAAGNVQIYGGYPYAGNGGQIEISGGSANGAGDGGSFTAVAGTGGITSGNGGNVSFAAGPALGGDGNGGYILFTPREGNGSGSNGRVLFQNPITSYMAVLDIYSIATSDKTFTFPNASGTFALLDRVGGQTFTTAQNISTSDTHLTLTNGAASSTLKTESYGLIITPAANGMYINGTFQGTAGTVFNGASTTFTISAASDTSYLYSFLNFLRYSSTFSSVADGYYIGGVNFYGYYNGETNATANFTSRVEGIGTYLKGILSFFVNDGTTTGASVAVADYKSTGIYQYLPVTTTLNNATTNAVDEVARIAHNSSGTPANGFGARQLFTLESSTTADQSAAAIDTSWVDATHASRKAKVQIKTWDTAERSGLAIEADGAAQDVYFEGGAGSGLPYGSCYGNEIGWSQASAAQDTWYIISDSDMADGHAGLNLVSHDGSGKLTVIKPGAYDVTIIASVECSALNKHVQLGMSLDGTVVDCTPHYEVSSPNAQLILATGGQLRFSANSYLEAAIRTTDTGTPDLSVDHLAIKIKQVGG